MQSCRLGRYSVAIEFGNPSCAGDDEMSALSLAPNIDAISFIVHALPGLGRFVRPRVAKIIARDEALQARELTETLAILDAAGVEGAFVSTFLFAIMPYDPDPRNDPAWDGRPRHPHWQRSNGSLIRRAWPRPPRPT